MKSVFLRFFPAVNLFLHLDGIILLRLQGHVKEVIDCILSDPDQLITSIDPVPLAEKKLIHSFHGKQRTYPDQTVYELFEEQAAKTPKQEALRFNETSWSYRELDERANQFPDAEKSCDSFF